MKINSLDQLINLAIERKSKKIAVVAADDKDILKVVAKAEEMNLAEFILVGDQAEIERLAKEGQFDIRAEIVDEADHKKAADRAVDLVVAKKADVLMKGMLHSSVFLRAILNKEKGLNLGKTISQISVMDKVDAEGLLLVTDCAINVEPDLMTKKTIIENAVQLAHKLDYEEPKVAVLASVETINPSMNDTLEAAALSKMAERNQISGCIIDGPLAFDNAVSKEAAAAKKITSPVAGQADILVVPNLTVGNILTKSFTYVAQKTVVAAMVGTAVPIVFTSRTESLEGKLLSIALATYIS